jgi:diphthamide biosynthesis methyltransferase
MGQADVLILNSGDEGPATLEREELLRLAHKTGVHVEVVDASDFLADVEGVGCLLRYRMPGVQAKTADESARSA